MKETRVNFDFRSKVLWKKKGREFPMQVFFERGSIVELSVSRGAIRLRTPARAESAGSRGDVIPLRNLATNARVWGRVDSEGAVEAVRR